MSVIRWGIIGCGNVCEHKSGPPLYQLPQCRLIAVTRRDALAGQDFARRHGPSAYEASVDSLLQRKDIDAVYIASPDPLHCEHSLAAAAQGKHVLVEKAMAMNAQECDAMIKASAQALRQLSVAYYRRCYPSILKARELIAEGLLGSIEKMWINDQFPTSHRIDLAHFLLGDIASISLQEQALPPDSHAEEGLVLSSYHTNGAVCVMNEGWNENHDIERVVIQGSLRRLVIDDLKAGRMWLTEGKQSHSVQQPGLPWTHYGLIDQVSNFLLGLTSNPCSGEEGRKSTVILDAIAAAATDGSRVPIHYS